MTPSRSVPPEVDVVVPVFDEQDAVEEFHRSLVTAIDKLRYRFTIVYVNDGSKDGTQKILDRLARSDSRVRVVELSRNFGHQAALSAGLDLAEADIVITMDGDGQHPPHLIPQMLALCESGYDIVLTQRMDDPQTAALKRWTSAAFYWAINRLSDTHILPGAADFRLMTRRAVLGLRQMKEYHRFLRGMVSWMGFRSVILPYESGTRIAGASKYSIGKMLRLALDAIFSFSLTPLWIGLLSGAFFFLLAGLEMAYVLSFWLTGRQGQLAPGWSSLVFVVLIVGGTITLNLGFVGVYIGYIFQQVKDRPVYLVRSIGAKPSARRSASRRG